MDACINGHEWMDGRMDGPGPEELVTGLVDI